MEKLNPLEAYAWDEIIEARKHIKTLADLLDISENYLTYQTDFLKGVTKNNKHLSISAINKAIDRIIEVKSI